LINTERSIPKEEMPKEEVHSKYLILMRKEEKVLPITTLGSSHQSMPSRRRISEGSDLAGAVILQILRSFEKPVFATLNPFQGLSIH
jgi:hypothetical protein